MDLPFGIMFLKKAELYSVITRLNVQSKIDKSKNHPPLWPVEKAILKWTYTGHKHLGSTIKSDHLSEGSKNNKLADFDMLDHNNMFKKEYKLLEKSRLDQPLENLVVRGYANYIDEHDHSQIVINKEGLLMGLVLSETDKQGWSLEKFNYFVYGHLMDHYGATALLLIALFGLWKIFLGE